jgi:hypothetical protein
MQARIYEVQMNTRDILEINEKKDFTYRKIIDIKVLIATLKFLAVHIKWVIQR